MSAPSIASAPDTVAHGKYATGMNLKAATVLITGGSSGIGLGFVKTFLAAGSKVVICGRRMDALEKVKKDHPEVEIFQGDVGTEASRVALFDTVTKRFPDLNIVVNNAGIQNQKHSLAQPPMPWSERQAEIDINFSAVVHMCTLFQPFLHPKTGTSSNCQILRPVHKTAADFESLFRPLYLLSLFQNPPSLISLPVWLITRWPQPPSTLLPRLPAIPTPCLCATSWRRRAYA